MKKSDLEFFIRIAFHSLEVNFNGIYGVRVESYYRGTTSGGPIRAIKMNTIIPVDMYPAQIELPSPAGMEFGVVVYTDLVESLWEKI